MNEGELSVEEKRHLNAIKLFMNAHEHEDDCMKLDQMSPSQQRVCISTYHLWLDHPENFETVWKWMFRLRALWPVIHVLESALTKAKNYLRRKGGN
ncbi:MAG: hypothetical protein O6948_09130 [Deltaproteobacteria bacterium]|nr:hypothetical protein [Deltaproteobacteria bacterium]